MNIFVTDSSPYKSAMVLPDKHIVKMPLETCQMLAIVCSDKWGHNFGTLLEQMVLPMLLRRVLFVIIPALNGQMSL